MMDVLKGFNQALDYIEEKLESEIDLKVVADQAYVSEYHFKRLFSLLAGVTLSEYIRRRRLTLAAQEIKDPGSKVIDVALKYSYQSPDAFTRAFHNFHGVTPTEARQGNHNLKAYPKMHFQLTIQGGVEMNYRVIEKEPFKVVGVKYDVEITGETLSPTYDSMIEDISESQFEELSSLSTGHPSGIVHATSDYKESQDGTGHFNQYIGAVSDVSPGAYETLEVPSRTWAVFEAPGEWEDVEETWTRIYSEWLPSSSYELADGPEMVADGDANTEIWIPVTRKG